MQQLEYLTHFLNTSSQYFRFCRWLTFPCKNKKKLFYRCDIVRPTEQLHAKNHMLRKVEQMGEACGFCAYPWHHDNQPTVSSHHMNIWLHLTWRVDSRWVMPLFFLISSCPHIFCSLKKKKPLNHSTWLNSTLKSSMTQQRLAVFSTLSFFFITDPGFLIKGGGGHLMRCSAVDDKCHWLWHIIKAERMKISNNAASGLDE